MTATGRSFTVISMIGVLREHVNVSSQHSSFLQLSEEFW